MSQIVCGPSWDIYSQGDEAVPELIAFDFDVASQDLSESLPYCARVTIQIKQPAVSGQAAGPEIEVLYDMQDSLVEHLERHGTVCRLVARITHFGVRELVFGLVDWDEFRPPVGQWMSEHSTYAIDVIEHADWSFYDEYFRPTPEILEYLEDRRTVDHIVKSGVDPSESRVIDFFFYGKRDQLIETTQTLRQRHYSTDDVNTVDGEPDIMCLEAHKRMTLDELYDETRQHRALAERQGINYDGWGTSHRT